MWTNEEPENTEDISVLESLIEWKDFLNPLVWCSFTLVP